MFTIFNVNIKREIRSLQFNHLQFYNFAICKSYAIYSWNTMWWQIVLIVNSIIQKFFVFINTNYMMIIRIIQQAQEGVIYVL